MGAAQDAVDIGCSTPKQVHVLWSETEQATVERMDAQCIDGRHVVAGGQRNGHITVHPPETVTGGHQAPPPPPGERSERNFAFPLPAPPWYALFFGGPPRRRLPRP